MLTEELIRSLKTKVSELKQLFVLGEQFLPHLDEVFVFFDEIKPLLDDIRHSVEDNMHKLPKLAKELSHVTEANETATSEVMDLVDKVIGKVNTVAETIDNYAEMTRNRDMQTAELLGAVIKEISENGNPFVHLDKLKDAEKYYRRADEDNDERIDTYNTLKKLTDEIAFEAGNIFMSLQVQDISAQQIAAVTNMLAEIRAKMKAILEKYHETNLHAQSFSEKNNSLQEIEMHREIVFDPNAMTSISNKDNRQEDIDKLIEKAGHGGDVEEALKDVEFDSKGDVKQQTADDDFEDIPITDSASNSDDGKESISQDDIDALFGNV